MMPAQFRIDLFTGIRELVGDFEPVVLPGVVRELTGLTNAQGRDGAAARFGLALAEECTLAETGEISQDLPVDDQVVLWAGNAGRDCLVVTNDRRVRDELLNRGIGVISMRKQKKLEILRR